MRIVDLSDQFSAEVFVKQPHSGTHIDSPAYLFKGAKPIGGFALERFMTEAVLLEFNGNESVGSIDDEHLEAAEEAAGLALREGEAVILHVGTKQRNIGLSQNGAEYLEFKGVSLVGIDIANIDGPNTAEIQAHRVLLSKEILVLEGVRNLESIDSSRFRLACFPMKIDASVSPVRALAILNDNTG